VARTVAVVDNFYDNIARALGMLYTLYYSKHKCPIEIHCYRSKEESWEAALVWIDNGKYVLNWDLEVQVNTKLQLGKATLIQRQTIEDLLTNESNSSYKKKWP
jgi:archaellum component FlaF (FlaF/FlaG flagellin family)